jgi:hypothetical protein
VEKAIKEMRDKKATGDDDVTGDVLKLLGEYGLELMTQLINSIYVTGEITNDARCTREIKTRIAMAKTAFNKKNTLFASKLDLNLRKKLVKCYIWCIALYGAETLTLWKVDQKCLESFEVWCWRRMEKIKWTDRVRN